MAFRSRAKAPPKIQCCQQNGVKAKSELKCTHLQSTCIPMISVLLRVGRLVQLVHSCGMHNSNTGEKSKRSRNN